MRRNPDVIVLAMALTLSVAAPARAQSPHLVWTATPTAEAMAAAYPPQAKAAGLGGRAVLSCAVTADGGLEACRPVSEDPADQGFAAAALALAPDFRMDPHLSDGSVVAGLRFSIPIRFTPAPPPPERPAPSPRAPAFGNPAGFPAWGGPGPYYPDRAVRMGINGLVVIDCRAAADGALSECVLVRESPVEMGFSDAVRAMLRKGYLKAARRVENGQPVDGEWVRIAVPFLVTKPR